MPRARRQAPRRCRTISCGPTRATANIRMWDYGGYSNYNALQTGVTRRFDKGYMFSVFYVWSKSLTINNDDFTRGLPNATDDETRRLDYSYANYDRPHNFVVNAVYQTPKFDERRRRDAPQRLAALGRLPLDERPAVRHQLHDPRASAMPTSPATTATRRAHRADLRSRQGATAAIPYRQFNTSCFAPPQPGSDGAESARFFMRLPADQQRRPVDLEAVRRLQEREVRVPRRRVQRAQPHAVHGRQRAGELREPDRPHHHEPPCSETNKNGFGTINGVPIPRTLQLVTRFTF